MSYSTNDVPKLSVPGAPPLEDAPDEDAIHPQIPALSCTTNLRKTKGQRKVVEVENAQGKPCGKATALYIKYCKSSEQWNPWHPVLSTHS